MTQAREECAPGVKEGHQYGVGEIISFSFSALQFLGKDREGVAMDMYSFCAVLGPGEGNRQLRRHWDTWLTRAHLEQLAAAGINTLRLPLGDW